MIFFKSESTRRDEVYILTQPLHTIRMWHKVNFLADFN